MALLAGAPTQATESAQRRDGLLLEAVMLRDAAKVKALLDQRASPDARSSENNDRTALFFAAEMGDARIVRLLVDRDADVKAVDKAHDETPVAAAARARQAEVVRMLLARDADAAQAVAWNGVFQRSGDVLDAAIATKRIPPDALSFLLDEAQRGGADEIAQRLRSAGAVPPKSVAIAPADLAVFAGSCRTEDGARSLAVSPTANGVQVSRGGTHQSLVPLDRTFFVREGERFPTLRFEITGDRAVAVLVPVRRDRWP